MSEFKPETLYDKIYRAHVISKESEKDLIYIDRHLVRNNCMVVIPGIALVVLYCYSSTTLVPL